MKKFIVLFTVIVSALVLMVATAAAQPTTYDSGFQVQNLGDGTATVNITFYNQDGSVEDQVDDTIAQGGSKTYFPLPAGVSSGFDGSVVISSDQPVAAITNVLGDGFDYGASYGGFDGGAGTANLPLIMRNNGGFSTRFNVQNTGASATSVTVSYANSSCTETASIQPGAAATFDQSTNTCLGSTYVGAATVAAASGGEIVATVIETGKDTLFAYNGFTAGSTEVVMPLVQANNSGFNTGVQVQNTGSASTDVTLSYTPVAGAGTACTETQTIGAGASKTFFLGAFRNGSPGTSNCAKGSRFVGSAAVSANSAGTDLVAIVNQTNFTNYGSAYNGFDPNAATGSLVMPLIMDRNSGFYTGFNIMNVGSSATVTCTFSNSSRTYSAQLGTNAAGNDVQNGKIANKYVGSASCSAPGGAIIAVVNELGTSTSSDLLFTYEAFNN